MNRSSVNSRSGRGKSEGRRSDTPVCCLLPSVLSRGQGLATEVSGIASSCVKAGGQSVATRGEIRRSGRVRKRAWAGRRAGRKDTQAHLDAGLDQGRDESLSQGRDQILGRALAGTLVPEPGPAPFAAGLVGFLAELLARRARVVPARIPPPGRPLGCGGGSGAQNWQDCSAVRSGYTTVCGRQLAGGEVLLWLLDDELSGLGLVPGDQSAEIHPGRDSLFSCVLEVPDCLVQARLGRPG